MILNFKQWGNILSESMAQTLTDRVMYKLKFRKVKFDHVGNEAIFAKSVENFFHILLESPDISKYKDLIKNDKDIKEKFVDIIYKCVHKTKDSINRMGQVKPNESNVLDLLKSNMFEFKEDIDDLFKSK
jgi:hypothetical protein